MRGGCWHWQICSWIKALCRTKSCHNAPCHCIHDLIYLRCNTQQGRNNSVDSPLRIQPYSRGWLSSEKRQISNHPLRILQLVTSKRVGVANWTNWLTKLISRTSCFIESLSYCTKYAISDILRLRTLTKSSREFLRFQSLREIYTAWQIFYEPRKFRATLFCHMIRQTYYNFVLYFRVAFKKWH